MPQLKQLSCAHSGGGGLGVGGWENWEAVGKAGALFPQTAPLSASQNAMKVNSLEN